MGVIHWHCQNCLAHNFTTIGVSPCAVLNGNGKCCYAGSLMMALQKCDLCRKNQNWGRDLCEHFDEDYNKRKSRLNLF